MPLKQYSYTNFNPNNFNKSQLQIIKKGILRNLNIAIYAKHNYSCVLMQKIYSTLNKKKFTYYRRLNMFTREQLNEIHNGLSCNLDVEIFAKPEFNNNQMFVIKECLDYNKKYSKNLNYNIFAKANYSSEFMYKIFNIMKDKKVKKEERINLLLLEN